MNKYDVLKENRLKKVSKKVKLYSIPGFSYVCICGIGIYSETGITIPANIDHEETHKGSDGVVKDVVVE